MFGIIATLSKPQFWSGFSFLCGSSCLLLSGILAQEQRTQKVFLFRSS
uniref:Cytochrome c oxidase assembly factor COX18 n=1 Tax=Molossus molossus TaxID=27622 RepID=A0A7J8JRQ4_MOLMO|nr:cytochrome c oxidase assembly factor COX18 [Molossus molossus]